MMFFSRTGIQVDHFVPNFSNYHCKRSHLCANVVPGKLRSLKASRKRFVCNETPCNLTETVNM